MSKAIRGSSITRRGILAAAPAALMTASVPAQAASQGVTPKLAKMIEEWKIARAEYLRLVEIDNAAVALHHSTAPEIPERIIAWPNSYADGIDRMPKEYGGHLRHCDRPCSPGSVLKYTLRPSWWRLQVETARWHQPTHWLAENIGIADAFEAADAASFAAAGCEVTNANMETAMLAVDGLECGFEDFEAQSFADVAAMARVLEVIVSDQQIHQWALGSLLDNVKRVADRLEV